VRADKAFELASRLFDLKKKHNKTFPAKNFAGLYRGHIVSPGTST
jgi:hypothetical protein